MHRVSRKFRPLYARLQLHHNTSNTRIRNFVWQNAIPTSICLVARVRLPWKVKTKTHNYVVVAKVNVRISTAAIILIAFVVTSSFQLCFQSSILDTPRYIDLRAFILFTVSHTKRFRLMRTAVRFRRNYLRFLLTWKLIRARCSYSLFAEILTVYCYEFV